MFLNLYAGDFLSWRYRLVGVAGVAVCGYLFWPVFVQNSVKRMKGRPGKPVYKGLSNLGNMCYLNSVLQALSSCDTFCAWLEKEFNKEDVLTVSLSVKELLSSLRCTKNVDESEVLSSGKVQERLISCHGWSDDGIQHDVHEAFILLFEAIGKERLSRSTDFSSLKFLPDTNQDEKLFKARQNRSPTIMRETCFPFETLTIFDRQCLQCLVHRRPSHVEKVTSISIYPSFAQSLPSNHQLDLEMLLKKHFDGELLTGVNCENCSVKAGAPVKTSQKRSMHILRAPQCLMLHLNRTYWTTFGEPAKLSNHVSFPVHLNMLQFMHPCLQIETKKSHFWYKLISVVVHLGAYNNYGHYITYKRVSVTGKEKWIRISDENVEFCSVNTVRKSCFYILIYERCPFDRPNCATSKL